MKTLTFTKSIPFAAAVALSLWGTAGFAQMTEFQQLEQQVINDLATVGVSSARVGMLTMGEVANLSALLDRTDTTDADKAASATKLIETATNEPTRLKANEGTLQLEQQAMVYLAGVGLSLPEGVMLTPSQLSRLNVIFGGTEPDSEKKAAAERVLAEAMMKIEPTEHSGTDQLEEQLTGKLAAIGVEKPRFEELTLSQVAVLNTIFDSKDDDATKKAAAMEVLMTN